MRANRNQSGKRGVAQPSHSELSPRFLFCRMMCRQDRPRYQQPGDGRGALQNQALPQQPASEAVTSRVAAPSTRERKSAERSAPLHRGATAEARSTGLIGSSLRRSCPKQSNAPASTRFSVARCGSPVRSRKSATVANGRAPRAWTSCVAAACPIPVTYRKPMRIASPSAIQRA